MLAIMSICFELCYNDKNHNFRRMNMLIENINSVIAGELKVRRAQVDAAVQLLDDGNTVPFIARYRKEATGELEDEQLRTIEERLAYLRNLSLIHI